MNSQQAANRILIVEDSDEDFYTTTRVLRKFGDFAVDRCSVGAEVLERLGGLESHGGPSCPSLIILDLNLPGKRDGRKVLADLKNDYRFQSIPVVIMTTSSNPQDVATCFRNGAAGYMTKPVDLGRFTENMKCLVAYWFDAVTLPAAAEARP